MSYMLPVPPCWTSILRPVLVRSACGKRYYTECMCSRELTHALPPRVTVLMLYKCITVYYEVVTGAAVVAVGTRGNDL
jgi:hypothetical protein